MTAQTYRFDASKFSAAEAKKWLRDHNVKTLSFEAATGKETSMDKEALIGKVVPAKQEKTPPEAKEEKWMGDAQPVYMVPPEAISFSEIDEYLASAETTERVKELTRMFQALTENIMWSPDTTDKTAALKSLVDEFDAKLTEAVSKDRSMGTIIREKVRDFLGLEKPMAKVEKDQSRFLIWKEGDLYRWLATYSNKYRDEDNPPEILSAKSHKDFVGKVDAGLLPFPELWHYHVKGTKWGLADWLAFDDATGFTLASGTVDAGHEKEAEAIAALPEPLAVSHGLEVKARSKQDPTIIEEYASYEISDLPLAAAANKLTGFHIVTEGAKQMSIPEAKKEHLRKVGLSEDAIAKLDADLAGKAAVAAAQGLEFKEGEQPTEAPPTEPAPAPDPGEPVPAEPFATRQEVADAIVAAVKPIAETIASLSGVITTMAKSDEERVAAKAADTPAFSIAALVTRQLSAVGQDGTRLSVADMALAKDKPKEAPAAASKTGIPFIDGLIGETPKQ